jgi:hypothetical protein
MMKWDRIVLTAVTMLLPGASSGITHAQVAPAHVYSDAGNIYIARGGATTKLTQSEMDVDPVLAPNGDYVVYTRQGRGRTVHGYDTSQTCSIEPRPDELRQINADGSGDRLLLRGRKGSPESQLCDFHNKQFSSDGRRLYFLTPGWATSGALHVFDTRSGDERFVTPANDLLVLSFCANKYKDDLVVLEHRYFLLGGSYDWYWLYDSTGKKELGPLGEFDTPDDMVRQAHGVWCASKP